MIRDQRIPCSCFTDFCSKYMAANLRPFQEIEGLKVDHNRCRRKLMRRTISLPAVIFLASWITVVAPVATSTGIERRNSAPPSSTEPPPETPNRIKLNVSLVNIFVTVFNKNHEMLTNLNQDDFRVFENSKEQTIELFSRKIRGPITAALLVDTSLSQRYLLGLEQEVASRVVHKILGDGDQAAVIGFDSDADPVLSSIATIRHAYNAGPAYPQKSAHIALPGK
jgi:hypothetical protein